MRSLFTIILLFLVTTFYCSPQLYYKGNKLKIYAAVQHVNRILNDTNFYNQIAQIKRFDNSKYTGQEIAEYIRHSDLVIEVKEAFMPIANASTKVPYRIKVSIFNFSSDLSTATNTLIHEIVHAVDLQDGDYDFTHSSNNNDDGSQDNTAPWVIGAIAEEFAKF